MIIITTSLNQSQSHDTSLINLCTVDVNLVLCFITLPKILK
jgi:hypothetical protein